MYAYKKLTAQDVAVVPFNAHKQYDFDSASCSTHKIDHYNTQWTSESISLYSSASSVYGGDSKNVIKYQQLDHLFYREFPHNHSNTLGSFHYLKQKRNLYEKANILSIPTGLYGYEVKPGSFYVKTSDGTEIIDDSYGNLLISGTFTSSDYPVDVRGNIFRLEPIKGFKDYDLGVYKDYALKFINPQFPEAGMKKVFYKRGEIKANEPSTYSTPDDIFEIDDSYFYNSFKYNRINFTPFTDPDLVNAQVNLPTPNPGNLTSQTKNSVTFAVGSGITRLDITPTLKQGKTYRITANITGITLNSAGFGEPFSDHIGIGNTLYETKFDQTNGGIHTVDHTFIATSDGKVRIYANSTAVVFDNISVKEIKYANHIPSLLFNSVTGSNVVSEHNERYNFNRDDDFSISFYMEPRVLSNPASTVAITVGDNFQGGKVFHVEGTIAYIVHTSPLTDFNGVDKFWGVGGVEVNGQQNNNIGEGETYTQAMVDSELTPTFLGSHVKSKTIAGYSDWWLPSSLEVEKFVSNPGFATDFIKDPSSGDTFNDLNIIGLGLGAQPSNTSLDLRIVTSNDSQYGFTTAGGATFADPLNPISSGVKSIPIQVSNIVNLIYLVRKVNLATFDNSRRYIISKSTTRSVIPTAMQGRSEVLNMDSTGGLTESGSNMQPLDIPSQPQFPYEIYMVSQSLHFDRSDGDNTVSISCEVTGSQGSAEKLTHILCQTSASNMELYFDGVLKESVDIRGSLKNQTQNKANLYIGSKGEESKTDGFDPDYHFKYFNGKLTSINIYEESFNQTEVKNISESLNGSPYIGNMFYQNGFATITHPKYNYILSGSTGDGTIDKLKFQGTHLMYEHEYQCTVDEHEFNQTFNMSTREIQSNNNYTLAGFTTSSHFKPYVTTIGLYNEQNDLLVVGKLGQPIRMSNETDTTFILRWDT